MVSGLVMNTLFSDYITLAVYYSNGGVDGKGSQEESNSKSSAANSRSCTSLDVWTVCIFGFLQKDILITQCPAAVTQAWPIVYSRLHTLFSVIDPT